jgi:hypothetical protein
LNHGPPGPLMRVAATSIRYSPLATSHDRLAVRVSRGRLPKMSAG